jgi:uncharacterized protein (TIGR03437 family)
LLAALSVGSLLNQDRHQMSRMTNFFVTRHIAILAILALIPNATAQLQFASVAGNYIRVLNGKFFIGSKQVSTTLGLTSQPVLHSQIAVSPIDTLPLPVLGGSGNDQPTDARLDAGGNIWIVGNTDSDDFALMNPIFSTKPAYTTAGFVMELDPTASHVLFATYLTGLKFQTQAPYASHATSLTIDSAGNVYVGGDTDQPDFPTTAGSVHPSGSGPGTGIASTYFYSYLLKISPEGKLLYSTLLDTGVSTCTGGSSCIGHDSTFAHVSSIAVDSTGAATVAGPEGGIYSSTGRVSRVAPDASKILWSNVVGASYGSIDQLVMAQGSTGSIRLLGRYAPLVVTPGLPALPGSPPGLFAANLSSDGSQQIYSTNLGQSLDAAVVGISIDGSGNAYLAGISSSAQFPSIAGVPNLGANFILRLDKTGALPQTLFRLPTGVVVAPPSFDAAGNVQILGANGALLTMSPAYDFTKPAIVGFANAASYAMNTGLYRNTLISFFGYALSPNTEIIMNGNAHVLYAGPTQINVETPPAFNSYGSAINVVLASQTISFTPAAVQSIGIFTTDGVYAAALNQDGTANSASNPAPLNSVVSLFGTGTDGSNASVYINSLPQDVFYFGPAPGLLGVFQANVLVTTMGAITLQAPGFFPGNLTSNSVRIYTK